MIGHCDCIANVCFSLRTFDIVLDSDRLEGVLLDCLFLVGEPGRTVLVQQVLHTTWVGAGSGTQGPLEPSITRGSIVGLHHCFVGPRSPTGLSWEAVQRVVPPRDRPQMVPVLYLRR